jgi:uncharacterized membrane-anchored protein
MLNTSKGEPVMKNTLICLAIAVSTIITLPISTVATPQKKEGKVEKEPAPETKQMSQEQLDSMLKALKEKEEISSKLKFQEGEIKLKDGLATIKASANFRYLDPDQADTVLVKIWGNPPQQEKSLGMIFRAGLDPASPDSWGIVITYVEDGYVEDDDAANVNYDDLLKEMQKGMSEANPERIKQGYEAIELIGWAAPPRYDKDAHKLYWARELSVASYSEHTLNYDIRALGRHGVLSLNAIAVMSQLQTVEKDMQEALSLVEFNEGKRYGDYVAGVDKVAAYGIGALIAGKLAAKAGLLKLLVSALAAGWKFLIILLIPLGVFLKKLLFGKRKEVTEPTAAE